MDALRHQEAQTKIARELSRVLAVIEFKIPTGAV